MQQSNSATVALWKTIFSNYNNALSLQSQTQDVLNKHINNLKSATAVSGDLSLLLQRELEGAKSAASSAASNYNNVAKQSQNLLQEYKAKNISNSSQLDSAIMEFKAMANKMEITVQDNRSMVAKMQSMMNDSISLDQRNLISEITAVWTSSINSNLKSQKAYSGMVEMVNSYKKSIGLSSLDNGTVELEGEDEDVSGTVTSKKQGNSRYFISIKTNQPNYEVTVKAVKSRSKAIVFNISTDDDGAVSFRTSRNLAKYTLQLWVDGTMISKTAVLK